MAQVEHNVIDAAEVDVRVGGLGHFQAPVRDGAGAFEGEVAVVE